MDNIMYKGIIDCLLGIIVVMVSFLAIINQTLFLIRAFDILGVILLINGLHEAYDYFFYNHKKGIFYLVHTLYYPYKL